MAPKKTQKMSLGDFLGDQSLGSWADEMEDMPVPSSSARTGYGGERSTGASGGGWGGDRPGGFERSASNYPPREQLPLPTKPPYTAHLGNLSFDATEGDIESHFSECAVTSVRIVEDKLERKPKGFGYVEFATLDGLKKALELHGSQFQGRNIKISVAEPPKERAEGRELNDWTRKGPLPDLPNQRRASDKGYSRFNDAGSDAGSERGNRRGPPPESDGRTRDLGNWERKGPLSPLPQTGPPREGARGRGGDLPVRERRQSPAAWGERSESHRGPRREFEGRPRVEHQQPVGEQDWRSKMKPDAPALSPSGTPDVSTPTSPAATPVAPAERPKLNLFKRTVSEANPSQPTSASDSKASPFGAARPIDTAAREQEIEEKRRVAAEKKKEADDKIREEKRAKEAANKAEKDKTTTDDKEGSKKDGDGATGKNFEILRREEDGNDDDNTIENENANGEIVEDKATLPQEKKAERSWRKPSAAPESTAENLDADGWSTVPAAGSRSRGNRRGGNQGARAIAS